MIIPTLFVLLATSGGQVAADKPTTPPAGAWEPVPLVTAEQRRAGFKGGEGCQWPRALAVAPSDASFAIFGTDVGGLFRSNDGGVTWSPCNIGYTPRGTAGIVIDPGNANRVLSVGANSSDGSYHGIYLSENRAASWRATFNANISGAYDGMRNQIVFDPATWDPAQKLTRVAYWSRIRKDKANWGNPEIAPALYRSEDGGRSWQKLPGSENYGGSTLAVHPRRAGTLYAGDETGLSLSRDSGKTFRRVLAGAVTGLDISPARPDTVFALVNNALRVSNDFGVTWSTNSLDGIKRGEDVIMNIKVSPVDANRMVLWRNQEGGYDWPRFLSEDGGKSWQKINMDATGAFVPQNARQGWFAWSPTDPKVLLSVGGDWPTRSTDGGRTLRYSGQGDNGILVGGPLAFNPHVPGLLFVASQDYNGAVTRDGGRTWTYVNPAKNGWGGFTYGGVAVSPELLAVGNAGGWGSPRKLRLSRDAGAAWTDDLEELSGTDTAFVDPVNEQVAFVHNLRTSDGGKNWKAMVGCDGVMTAGKRLLFGIKKGSQNDRKIVKSSDRGLTWSDVAGAPSGDIRDLAWDDQSVTLYVIRGDALESVADGQTKAVIMPKDQLGRTPLRSVAFDPKTRTLFTGSAGNTYNTDVAVWRRRENAGWEPLNQKTPLQNGQVDGGREALWVRIDPSTGDLWVATSCYGIWRWKAQ